MKRYLLIVLICFDLSAEGARREKNEEMSQEVKRVEKSLENKTLQSLADINQELSFSRKRIKEKYELARSLYEKNGPETEYKKLLDEIQSLRQEIVFKEKNFREECRF